MKKILMITTAAIIGLYTTFVLTCCWNWFAIPVFNISSISYLEMIGLTLLISFFVRQNRDQSMEYRWDMILKLLDACIPDDKKEAIQELLKSEKKNIWAEAGVKISGKFFENTMMLIFAWCLHVFVVR